MSVLGKAYLGFFLVVFVVGIAWGSTTLQSNASLVEIVLAIPRVDMLEPVRRVRYEVNLAWLMAGWVVAGGLIVLASMRAPFRIRAAAVLALMGQQSRETAGAASSALAAERRRQRIAPMRS